MTNFLAMAFGIICTIESCNGKYMVNKTDPSCVGWAGIRPIVVTDCNRILGHNHYKLNDRYNRQKCEEMFKLIVNTYLPKDPTLPQVARLWCRGKSRMYKPMTPTVLNYLTRVEEEEERRYAIITLAGTH